MLNRAEIKRQFEEAGAQAGSIALFNYKQSLTKYFNSFFASIGVPQPEYQFGELAKTFIKNMNFTGENIAQFKKYGYEICDFRDKRTLWKCESLSSQLSHQKMVRNSPFTSAVAKGIAEEKIAEIEGQLAALYTNVNKLGGRRKTRKTKSKSRKGKKRL